jgi:hypothetical protein
MGRVALLPVFCDWCLMITFADFQKVYLESGEVAARLVADAVIESGRYEIFSVYPELAPWLRGYEIPDNNWTLLISVSDPARYLPYCDMSKRDFNFVCIVLMHHQEWHNLLDFHKVRQSIWSRLLSACSRADIDLFIKYVDRDQLSASALWKLEQYEMGLE